MSQYTRIILIMNIDYHGLLSIEYIIKWLSLFLNEPRKPTCSPFY